MRIFWFSWFEPIWFYNPSSSFPRDDIEAGFFLNIADNTGYGVSYKILLLDTVKKIRKYRNPVTLIISVVRSWVLDSTHAPSRVESQACFKFEPNLY